MLKNPQATFQSRSQPCVWSSYRGWVDGRAAKTISDQLSVQGPGVYSRGVQLTDKETYKSDYAT